MRGKNIPEKYIRIVQDMYKESETKVRCIAGTTEPFKVEVGLHQGSALSPFLFAIIMDTLTESIRKEAPWNMMFADDVVLCCEEKIELEKNLERWHDRLEKRRMKKQRSAEGSAEGWTNWKKMAGVMYDKRVPARVKGKIHRTVIQPAMLYGLETVPRTKKATRRLEEVAEMKMCRWACGLTMRNRMRNGEIRERMGVTKIEAKRGELHRKRMMSMVPPGRRGRGRPKQRWMDNVKEDRRYVGVREEDTQERKIWKAFVSAAATPEMGEA
ncbi:uncharacterized protein LOC125047925 [Penaeus chinensis]|uniref:uncharacterized protein LOC125047925 n=1 Tax=Penaeus chinensis TaxID=139456 RepID=UPI001FB57F75|nr:uncharacterized protein LOC125047925 [Penaeus chinensis]